MKLIHIVEFKWIRGWISCLLYGSVLKNEYRKELKANVYFAILLTVIFLYTFHTNGLFTDI